MYYKRVEVLTIRQEQEENGNENHSVLRGENAPLAEARKKLLDRTTYIEVQEPEDITLLRSNPEKRDEYLSGFKSEIWLSYRQAVRDLMDSEEMHALALQRGRSGISMSDIREVVERHGIVKPELLEEVCHRIHVFMFRSLDVEVVKVRLKTLLDKNPDDEELKFNEDEKIELFNIFDKDYRLQDIWARIMARNIWHNSNFECDEKDIADVELLVGRLMRLNGDKNSEQLGKKVRNIFFDEIGHPRPIMHVGRRNDADASLKLVGVRELDPGDTDRYLNEALMFGMREFLEEREEKVEMARFLCKLEELQDDLLGFDLPTVQHYRIVESNEDVVKASAYGKYKTICWGPGRRITVDEQGLWLNEIVNSGFDTFFWDDDRTVAESRKTYSKVWISAWISMAHERGHLSFVSLYSDKDNWAQIAKLILGTASHSVTSVDKNFGTKRDQEFKGIHSQYFHSISSALDEGYSVLLERISIKYLEDNKDIFEGDLDDGDLETLENFTRGRVVNDVLGQNHYWLGRKIIGIFYAEGFRDDVEGLQELSASEHYERRKQNGLRRVRSFLQMLDVNKISDNNSRRLFEETRIEDENAPVVERMVWERRGGVMVLVKKEDKKNRLLDYMSSTDSKKRKLGMEKFMELFGK